MTSEEVRRQLAQVVFSDSAMEWAVEALKLSPEADDLRRLVCVRLIAAAYDAGVNEGYYTALERAGMYGDPAEGN